MFDRKLRIWKRRVVARNAASSTHALALLAMTALLLPAAVAAEGEKRAMTLLDVARLDTVRSVSLAPSGDQIAYVLSQPREPMSDNDGPAWNELHIVDLEKNSRPFVAGEVNVSGLSWHASDDGWAVSFLTTRGDDEHPALYSIPLRGGEAQKIFSLDRPIQGYTWSPDGKTLAVAATEAEPKELETLREQGFSQKVYEEDGQLVRLWLVGDSGRGEPKMVELDHSVIDMEWSPQGDRLALKVAPTPLIDDEYMQSRVWVVAAGSGEVQAKIDNPGKLGEIAWSTDGSRLALISAADFNDPREGRLMVVSADGGALEDLMPGFKGHVQRAMFRDADTVVFLAAQGTATWIGEIDLADRKPRRLLDGGPVLGGLELGADGGMAAVGSTPEHPSEVYYLPAGADSAHRLTHSNPWLDEVRLARQEVIRYEARDGLELEGMLVRPLDIPPGQRVPLILVVHGGPEAHYSNGWLTGYNNPAQVAAGRGFAVFFPNYRASTGRGVAFSKLDHHDPAGKEFDDLVDGVDHLIDMGLVDRNKVGITGGSYGGYATAWGATYYSERFAAAVMSVGISNKISSLGNSDIANELVEVHIRQWPWDNWQHYLERSPIYHVEKAKTPLLIVHGEEDTRVFPGQSMELYRFLKVRDQAPVRLVLYPGEGHGNRRAASRYDFSLRLMRWMEHYLQGTGGEAPAREIDYQAEICADEPTAKGCD